MTRRYGKYRPCGAGLGVLWGGLLLGLLGVLLLQWTRHEYAASAVPSQTLWRFLRDTPLTPPGWLQIAATVSPFIGWLGLLAIQVWVDRQFGAVTSQRLSRDCPRRGPRWLAMLAIAAWAVVWGRRSMQGVMRFPGFLKVRADLAAIQPVDE